MFTRDIQNALINISYQLEKANELKEKEIELKEKEIELQRVIHGLSKRSDDSEKHDFRTSLRTK